MGLTAIPMQAETGPIGGNMSHEFQILAADRRECGLLRRRLRADRLRARADLDVEQLKSLYAAADEKHDPAAARCRRSACASGRGIEVGHIFYFGTKYSQPMGATVMGPDGTEVPVEMGSYGIGVSRLVGALIEAFHDEDGIIWPETVAPFRVGAGQPAPRRCRLPARWPRTSTAACARWASTCSWTTATSAPAPSSPPWT